MDGVANIVRGGASDVGGWDMQGSRPTAAADYSGEATQSSWWVEIIMKLARTVPWWQLPSFLPSSSAAAAKVLGNNNNATAVTTRGGEGGGGYWVAAGRKLPPAL